MLGMFMSLTIILLAKLTSFCLGEVDWETVRPRTYVITSCHSERMYNALVNMAIAENAGGGASLIDTPTEKKDHSR